MLTVSFFAKRIVSVICLEQKTIFGKKLGNGGQNPQIVFHHFTIYSDI